MADFLLDVNVLVAHAILEHVHHDAVADWLRRSSKSSGTFHVSPVIELGLVRNAMRIGSLSIKDARRLLENERFNLRLEWVPDSVSASQLPDWVHGYRQTTDAYLSVLAEEHDLALLTIDKGIPGATRILS